MVGYSLYMDNFGERYGLSIIAAGVPIYFLFAPTAANPAADPEPIRYFFLSDRRSVVVWPALTLMSLISVA